MTRIYISDVGDDRNDGLTRETAIYSWQRAVKLCDGNTETNLMQGDVTLQRLIDLTSFAFLMLSNVIQRPCTSASSPPYASVS